MKNRERLGQMKTWRMERKSTCWDDFILLKIESVNIIPVFFFFSFSLLSVGVLWNARGEQLPSSERADGKTKGNWRSQEEAAGTGAGHSSPGETHQVNMYKHIVVYEYNAVKRRATSLRVHTMCRITGGNRWLTVQAKHNTELQK